MLPAQVSYWTLQENKRHNLATERATEYDNITKRRAQEETARHNLAFERETSRHNVQSEYLEGQHIALGWSQLSETKRSNIAREAETGRSNVAKETETNRSNVTKEKETARDNKTKNALSWYQTTLGFIGSGLKMAGMAKAGAGTGLMIR